MKSKIFKILLILVFAAAVYLRVDAYLINNSFFTDEILLAANIFERDGWGFLYPLNYHQSAPIGFMILSKIFVTKTGISELYFRFIPFISSILSVVFFYLLSKVVFKNKYCTLLSLLVFGLSYQLIFYSQVFKQYSVDVMIAVLFLYLAFKIYDKIKDYRGSLAVGFVSFLVLCFSFPMFIIVPAFYTAWFITGKGYRIKIINSLPCLLVGGVFFIRFYSKYVKTSAYLINYWHKGFELFKPEIYKINFDFLFYDYAFGLMLIVLSVCGFYFLFKRNKFYFWTLFLAVFYTMLAALFKFYPFERRLILFLLPILIIVSIYPLDNLKKNIPSGVIAIIASVFFGYGILNFSKDFVFGNISYLRQDVKPLLAQIVDKKPEESLYIYYGALSSYSYYSQIMDLPKESLIYGTYPKDENLSEKYLINDFEHLPKGLYYIFLVKGTWTYDKDIDAALLWLNKYAQVKEDENLKSARLIKVYIK